MRDYEDTGLHNNIFFLLQKNVLLLLYSQVLFPHPYQANKGIHMKRILATKPLSSSSQNELNVPKTQIFYPWCGRVDPKVG